MPGQKTTVFHLTHVKSGSQWVAEILKHSAPERFVPARARIGHVVDDPIRPGGVYPAVYLNRRDFESSVGEAAADKRAFFVLRDLRDTLVSLYFSLKLSHAVTNSFQSRLRKHLAGASEERGLLDLIDQETRGISMQEFLALPVSAQFSWVENHEAPAGWIAAQIADIQRSWVRTSILCIRYEDLIANEQEVFREIIEHCQIGVAPATLHAIVHHNNFERATGRRRGEEEPTSHLRKGVAGDWRNHFSERVKDEFKKTFGSLLIETGYERDLEW